jgi:hypothetical protein
LIPRMFIFESFSVPKLRIACYLSGYAEAFQFLFTQINGSYNAPSVVIA